MADDPNLIQNMANYFSNTAQAANMHDANGYLVNGGGYWGAAAGGQQIGLNQAQERQNTQKAAAETQGLQNQNQLFPLQMQMAQAQMKLLNNVANPQQNSSPSQSVVPSSVTNTGQSGQGGSSAGSTITSPQQISKPVNNPGNLRPQGQSTGFQQFNTPQDGEDALYADLTDKIRGNSPAMVANFGKNYQPTLQNIITTFAPPSENDTQGYIANISKQSGIAPDQNVRLADLSKIVPLIKQQEGTSQSQQQPATNPSYNQLIQATPRETSMAALDKFMPGIGKLGEQEQAARIAPLQAAETEHAKLPGKLAAESTKDFYGKDNDVYNSALATKSNMKQLTAELDSLNQQPGYWNTGSGGTGRLAVAKAWNASMQSMGKDPVNNPDIFFNPEKIGTAEALSSQSTITGLEASKEFFGGQREAQQIIGKVLGTKPSLESSYQGGKQIANAFNETSNYFIDRRNFQIEWLKDHPGDLTGANEAFNKTNSPEAYGTRAISQYQPIKVNTASGLKQLLPGTKVITPNHPNGAIIPGGENAGLGQ